MISVLSESRSRIAHSLLTEAEQPVDTVLEDNLDDIYQDEILYTLLPQESRKRNGFELKIRRFIQIPCKKSALHSASYESLTLSDSTPASHRGLVAQVVQVASRPGSPISTRLQSFTRRSWNFRGSNLDATKIIPRNIQKLVAVHKPHAALHFLTTR